MYVYIYMYMMTRSILVCMMFVVCVIETDNQNRIYLFMMLFKNNWVFGDLIFTEGASRGLTSSLVSDRNVCSSRSSSIGNSVPPCFHRGCRSQH